MVVSGGRPGNRRADPIGDSVWAPCGSFRLTAAAGAFTLSEAPEAHYDYLRASVPDGATHRVFAARHKVGRDLRTRHFSRGQCAAEGWQRASLRAVRGAILGA